MKFLKFISVLAILVLVFQVVNISSASAAEKTNSTYYELDVVKSDDGLVSNDKFPTEIQATSTNKIWVYFKGLAVASVVLGTIMYTTGKAPAEWVSWGLTATENKIKQFANSASYVPGKPIYVATNGDINACIVFPCAVASSIKPLESLEASEEMNSRENLLLELE